MGRFGFICAPSASRGRDGERAADPLHRARINAKTLGDAAYTFTSALTVVQGRLDPSLGVRNCAAPGRSATWTEGEVARLFKHAWRTGYHGLAAVTAVMSSTQMSPGDVRTSRASQLAHRSGLG